MTKTVPQLRLEARLAFLYGRVKRAKLLNKQADKLEWAASAKAYGEVRAKAVTAASLFNNPMGWMK